jgi:hypothetical protein
LGYTITPITVPFVAGVSALASISSVAGARVAMLRIKIQDPVFILTRRSEIRIQDKHSGRIPDPDGLETIFLV